MNNKIVVFISGRGSNAKNIINYFNDNSDFQVSHVFSNNRYSDFPNHIKNKNVQYYLFEEAEINGKVFNELKKINPKLIILAGFLKKIPPLYINFFKNKNYKISWISFYSNESLEIDKAIKYYDLSENSFLKNYFFINRLLKNENFSTVHLHYIGKFSYLLLFFKIKR